MAGTPVNNLLQTRLRGDYYQPVFLHTFQDPITLENKLRYNMTTTL